MTATGRGPRILEWDSCPHASAVGTFVGVMDQFRESPTRRCNMREFRCEMCGKRNRKRDVCGSDARRTGPRAHWRAQGHCSACRNRLVRLWSCRDCGSTGLQSRGRPRKFCKRCLVGHARLLVSVRFACEACDVRGEAPPSRACPACGRLVAYSDSRAVAVEITSIRP